MEESRGFAVRDDRTLCGLFGGCSSPNSIKIQSRSHKSGGGKGQQDGPGVC